MKRTFAVTTLIFGVALAGALAAAQRRDAFVASRTHPAIQYGIAPAADAVSALNRRLQDGSASLRFDETSGYLRSVLEALNVPVESQALVFSQASLQAPFISMHNPRAIYFSDTVSVGWVRGGDLIEVAAQDPRQGMLFYSLEQKPASSPKFTQQNECLACHLSWETLGVPGLMVQSVYPLPDEKSYINGFNTIHGSPLTQRWGGWWVTGDPGGARHLGNVPVMPADKGRSKLANPTAPLASVQGQFDLKGYPSPHSDVVALMVLEHQARMTNLITWAGWEGRIAAASPTPDAMSRAQGAARELVDYLLFIDEEPLTAAIQGSSKFAGVFAAQGPRDGKGRSLRELDLRRRMFKYPCSYMIYTAAFDALPALAKDAVYARMWEVLSGREKQPRYRVLSLVDRQAIVQILRDTKKDLPRYFEPVR
jgi:hypothetical protein